MKEVREVKEVKEAKKVKKEAKTNLKLEGGTHADEIETSLMLFIASASVRMDKAVKDYSPDHGRLTRKNDGSGTYSPTGIWGDPTLATLEKGKKIADALVQGIYADIEKLRGRTLTLPSP